MAGTIELNAIGGVATISIDGVEYDVSPVAKSNVHENSREGIPKAGGGFAGFKDTAVGPFVEFEFLTRRDQSLNTLRRKTDATVVLRQKNGWVVSLEHAWYAGAPDLDNAEGKSTLKFEGKTATVLE